VLGEALRGLPFSSINFSLVRLFDRACLRSIFPAFFPFVIAAIAFSWLDTLFVLFPFPHLRFYDAPSLLLPPLGEEKDQGAPLPTR